jgi:hypothetical protein
MRDGRASRGCDQVALHVGLIHPDVGVVASRAGDVGADGRISGAGAAFQYAGRRQQLRAVADRGDRLIRSGIAKFLGETLDGPACCRGRWARREPNLHR